MYQIPFIHVPELAKIKFKRDSHQVISVSFYLEALIEALLRLQIFALVVSVGKTCLYSKMILQVRVLAFSAPNRIIWGERFYELNYF